MIEEPTTRQHDSENHHGITYLSVQGGSNIIITDAQTNSILLETVGTQVLFQNKELNIHDLAEVTAIASELTKER